MTSTMTTSTAHVNGARLRFGSVVRSEFIKFTRSRSTWWVSASFLVVAVGVTVLFAFAQRTMDSSSAGASGDHSAETTMLLTLSPSLLQIVVALFGVLIMTGEYSSGLIRASLTVVPHRSLLLGAKAVVILCYAAVLGVVSLALNLLVAVIAFGADWVVSPFTHWAVAQPALGSVLYLIVVGLFSLGMGAIIRNSAGGITAAMCVLFVLPTALGLISAFVRWVAQLVPLALSSAGSQMSTFADPSKSGVHFAETFGGSILIAAVWMVVALALGCFVLVRRDA